MAIVDYVRRELASIDASASIQTAASQMAEQSIGCLRSAVRTWGATDAPYETALTRTLLAEAYLAAGDAHAAHGRIIAPLSSRGTPIGRVPRDPPGLRIPRRPAR